MNRKYFTFIDPIEFQSMILEYINSDDFDKMFNSTVFADNVDCRQAMIHGMCIASALSSKCNHFIFSKEEEE